ncbi:transmembrane protein 230 isoform X1 [Tribolium castaneum]|uniref:Transmembrane protein 230 n=3 Tax=Tribolium castaneum TaxID=7070 RepID=A0A139WNF0_TRICA|nr:PREDICTED: transmembrane protein 230 isoform X1 [Tribolium castaneum]XP_974035.2 PREDICTED: transmembrane protein 230 isoform X1 [Tribolium castaneum]KYB29397.1 Transmembrane protein 230-like Protein [Tribolium castaneum]|eukprot:XP_015840513.1 PREDICTED: transmembrane protein 230 isoform X1 [Tribolium castaneum]
MNFKSLSPLTTEFDNGRTSTSQISLLPTMSLHSITEYLDDLKMSRRRGRDYDHVDYTKLAPADKDNGFIDAQFITPAQKVPWKAICLATMLLVVGTFLLIFGSLVVSGHIILNYSDRMWPMIILGLLMFIPGAYHVRIAYYAYKQVPGYSFDDIPEFD